MYDAGLASRRLWAQDMNGHRFRLPIEDWTAESVPGDHSLVGRCHGPTLDIGCGPGRLLAALAVQGIDALGIDISAAAVAKARAVGASAIHSSVFAPIPQSGRWLCAILADGNIGIGGDPKSLIRRLRRVLDPRGVIHVEVASNAARTAVFELRLADEFGQLSQPFPWAQVSLDGLAAMARECGLIEGERWESAGRWFVSLRRTS